MPVVATFQVNFSEQAADVNASIQFELDSTRTQFFPGQDVPIRCYYVGTLVALRSNLGSLTNNGSDAKAVEDERIAVNGDSASLAYPATSGLSLAWEGIVLDEDGNEVAGAATPTLQGNLKTLALDEKRYGVLVASYNAAYIRRILTGVPTENLEATVIGMVS
jgi:hypothetical protein